MKEQQDKARRYSRIKEYIRLVSIPYEIFFLLLMIFFLSENFVSFTETFTDIRYLKILIYGIFFLLFHTIFTLPLDLYSGYILEQKFKLSTENIIGWIKFQLKGILFSLLLGLPLLILFYYIVDSFPKFWWLIAATCFFVISLILSFLIPFIIPFFYKLEPLDMEELKSKIKKIIWKGGLKLEGVYRIKLGARTKKANAGLTGMGRTKRVLLSDTLLESKFSENEIASVTAHEVGHYVYKHIWKLIFIEVLISYSLFYIIYNVMDKVIELLSYGSINNIVNFPVILLIFTILNLIVGPVNNFFNRHFEYQADSYATKVTNKKSFISSLNNLAKVNLVDKNPSRIIELLFHSHPSIQHRIKRINKTI